MTPEERRKLWSRCPLGWYNGRIIRTASTTDEDIIRWLQEVEQALVGELSVSVTQSCRGTGAEGMTNHIKQEHTPQPIESDEENNTLWNHFLVKCVLAIGGFMVGMYLAHSWPWWK